jgi:hypothetical protein
MAMRFSSLMSIVALAGSLGLGASALAQSGSGTEGEAPKRSGPVDMDSPFDNMGTNKDDPNAAVVYLIRVRGEVGTDFSTTPLKRMIDDAAKFQPDFIILDIDSTFRPDRRTGVGESYSPQDASRAFNLVDRVTEMSGVLINDIRDGAQWKKKPRIVAWVRNAIGPAAFLPFVAKDIYYTENARHGGIGFLDLMFAGVGDEVVREKQRSLRMGRAEGIVIKGGHDFRILRAMAREDYVLSYTMVGGVPEFHEDMSGDTILTDDGVGPRGDSAEDILRNQGNDVLTLTTPVAKRIGFIAGEANTLDDLAFELGIQRAYKVYGRRAERFAADWRRQVDNVLPQLQRIQRDIQEFRIEGQTPAERNQSRARLKRLLNQMIDLLGRNKEVSAAAGFDPDGEIDSLKQEIARIDQQIRLDRDR